MTVLAQCELILHIDQTSPLYTTTMMISHDFSIRKHGTQITTLNLLKVAEGDRRLIRQESKTYILVGYSELITIYSTP